MNIKLNGTVYAVGVASVSRTLRRTLRKASFINMTITAYLRSAETCEATKPTAEDAPCLPKRNA